MIQKHAKEQPLINAEVVLNLWAYATQEGYVMRLAGKSYVMQGSDEDKLALLRTLSGTDFLSAPWQKVPKSYTLNSADGRTMEGIVSLSTLHNPLEHSYLFGSLIEELARTLPMQLCNHSGEYKQFQMPLPDSPLTVTTTVVEYEDGRLIPMVSG